MVNSRKKGLRNQRKAVDVYESVGFNAITPNATKFQREDFFGYFDIIAMHPETKPHYVQVKSESARGINDFSDSVMDIVPSEYVRVFYFVYHSYEGWRIIEISDSEYTTVYDGRDNGKNIGEGAKDFLSQFV